MSVHQHSSSNENTHSGSFFSPSQPLASLSPQYHNIDTAIDAGASVRHSLRKKATKFLLPHCRLSEEGLTTTTTNITTHIAQEEAVSSAAIIINHKAHERNTTKGQSLQSSCHHKSYYGASGSCRPVESETILSSSTPHSFVLVDTEARIHVKEAVRPRERRSIADEDDEAAGIKFSSCRNSEAAHVESACEDGGSRQRRLSSVASRSSKAHDADDAVVMDRPPREPSASFSTPHHSSPLMLCPVYNAFDIPMVTAGEHVRETAHDNNITVLGTKPREAFLANTEEDRACDPELMAIVSHMDDDTAIRSSCTGKHATSSRNRSSVLDAARPAAIYTFTGGMHLPYDEDEEEDNDGDTFGNQFRSQFYMNDRGSGGSESTSHRDDSAEDEEDCFFDFRTPLSPCPSATAPRFNVLSRSFPSGPRGSRHYYPHPQGAAYHSGDFSNASPPIDASSPTTTLYSVQCGADSFGASPPLGASCVPSYPSSRRAGRRLSGSPPEGLYKVRSVHVEPQQQQQQRYPQHSSSDARDAVCVSPHAVLLYSHSPPSGTEIVSGCRLPEEQFESPMLQRRVEQPTSLTSVWRGTAAASSPEAFEDASIHTPPLPPSSCASRCPKLSLPSSGREAVRKLTPEVSGAHQMPPALAHQNAVADVQQQQQHHIQCEDDIDVVESGDASTPPRSRKPTPTPASPTLSRVHPVSSACPSDGAGIYDFLPEETVLFPQPTKTTAASAETLLRPCFAFANLQGCRNHQEDSFLILTDIAVSCGGGGGDTSGEPPSFQSTRSPLSPSNTQFAKKNEEDAIKTLSCFGVFDGHNGMEVSQKASQYFQEHFQLAYQQHHDRQRTREQQKQQLDPNDPSVMLTEDESTLLLQDEHRVLSSALVQSLLHLDVTLYDTLKSFNTNAGSTACVAACHVPQQPLSLPTHRNVGTHKLNQPSNPAWQQIADDMPQISSVASPPAQAEEQPGGEAATLFSNMADVEGVDYLRVSIANLGDSRAVIGRLGDGQLLLETQDHRIASYPSEASRITSCGGALEFNRIDGCLDVTRGLGDYRLKNHPSTWWQRCNQNDSLSLKASSPPEEAAGQFQGNVMCNIADVYEVEVRHHDFLVIASDGVWDRMSSIDVVAFVARELGSLLCDPNNSHQHLDGSIESCSPHPKDDDNNNNDTNSNNNIDETPHAQRTRPSFCSTDTPPLLHHDGDRAACAQKYNPAAATSTPLSPPSAAEKYAETANRNSNSNNHNNNNNNNNQSLVMSLDLGRMPSASSCCYNTPQMTPARHVPDGMVSVELLPCSAALSPNIAADTSGIMHTTGRVPPLDAAPLFNLPRAASCGLRKPPPSSCRSTSFDNAAHPSLLRRTANRLADHVVHTLNGSDNTTVIIVLFATAASGDGAGSGPCADSLLLEGAAGRMGIHNV